MRTSTYSEFRRRLSEIMDSVAEDHEPVIVTRSGGKPAAVLMSLEDYASLEETHYLMVSPANAKRLHEAVADVEKGRFVVRELDE